MKGKYRTLNRVKDFFYYFRGPFFGWLLNQWPGFKEKHNKKFSNFIDDKYI